MPINPEGVITGWREFNTEHKWIWVMRGRPHQRLTVPHPTPWVISMCFRWFPTAIIFFSVPQAFCQPQKATVSSWQDLNAWKWAALGSFLNYWVEVVEAGVHLPSPSSGIILTQYNLCHFLKFPRGFEFQLPTVDAD